MAAPRIEFVLFAGGFVARHVRGVDEARRALDAEGAIAG